MLFPQLRTPTKKRTLRLEDLSDSRVHALLRRNLQSGCTCAAKTAAACPLYPPHISRLSSRTQTAPPPFRSQHHHFMKFGLPNPPHCRIPAHGHAWSLRFWTPLWLFLVRRPPLPRQAISFGSSHLTLVLSPCSRSVRSRSNLSFTQEVSSKAWTILDFFPN